MISILQLAALFNSAGVGIVLLVSLLVVRPYIATFFRPWLFAYGSIFFFLVGEVAASFAGRPWPLALYEVVAMSSAVWFLGQTVLHFRGQRLPHVLYGIWLGGNVALSAFLLGRGLPFEAAALVPELGLAAGLIWLGVTVMRSRLDEPREGLNWLGLPLIVTGLLPFTFPLVIGTPIAWIGFLIAGLCNVLIGIGMVVYLLENTASRLRQTNRELRKLDEMKTSFLATVSHELRTPLTAIKGAASVLASPEGAAVAPRLLPLVLNNAMRLEGLITDLLDATSIEAGRMRYQRQPADLGRLVSEVAAASAPQIEGRKLAFSTRVPETPIPVLVDAGRIHQVVTNLLTNAAKFTDPGGSVSLTVRQEGGEAVLEVADTGIGIPAEHREKVFDKFYQVDGGDTRRANGSGLGLSIVQAIVEEGHGGKLELESAPGVGTTFRVRLALAEEAEKTLTNS
ncbi:MAG: sensor histidine kinase [Candidatus Sericytochromatia bacterium]